MSATTSSASLGLLCALPQELGTLSTSVAARRRVLGIEILELELGAARLLACVSGVGKVHAARAATLLLCEGATGGLLVVGTCGGLRQHLVPGTLVHCSRATQTDYAVRAGREVESDARLRAAWRAVAPGVEGWFLTADRPVLSLWRRLRLSRAFLGACVADMETAAVASVASRSGVPWAALRAVTDRSTEGGHVAFRTHFPSQAGRAADTVPRLLARLADPGAEGGLPALGTSV